MNARQAIMGRLKTTLDKCHNPTVRISGVDQRLKELKPGLIPKRGQAPLADRPAMFKAEAEKADSQVINLASMDDVPGAVRDILSQNKVQKIKAAPHPDLLALTWGGIDIFYGRGEGEDLIGLSMAYAGVSETGTLVLRSGPDAPTTLNFLPDVHVVVLRTPDLAANYETVWTKLRNDEGDFPRTVNWITGPSRSADIEQTLLLGAHGPRKLVILLVDEKT